MRERGRRKRGSEERGRKSYDCPGAQRQRESEIEIHRVAQRHKEARLNALAWSFWTAAGLS